MLRGKRFTDAAKIAPSNFCEKLCRVLRRTYKNRSSRIKKYECEKKSRHRSNSRWPYFRGTRSFDRFLVYRPVIMPRRVRKIERREIDIEKEARSFTTPTGTIAQDSLNSLALSLFPSRRFFLSCSCGSSQGSFAIERATIYTKNHVLHTVSRGTIEQSENCVYIFIYFAIYTPPRKRLKGAIHVRVEQTAINIFLFYTRRYRGAQTLAIPLPRLFIIHRLYIRYNSYIFTYMYWSKSI